MLRNNGCLLMDAPLAEPIMMALEINSTTKMITRLRVIENKRITQEFILVQFNLDLHPIVLRSFRTSTI